MDASITQFILDVDGQLVRYAHGPQIPTAVQWPGPRGSSQVRASIVHPAPAAAPRRLITDGPWALFRMFERVQLDRGSSPEKFRATFNDRRSQGDLRRHARAACATRSGSPELAEFQCPQGL